MNAALSPSMTKTLIALLALFAQIGCMAPDGPEDTLSAHGADMASKTATSTTPRLKAIHMVPMDGAEPQPSFTYQDTKLDTECGPAKASNGRTFCFPGIANWVSYYADDKCATPLVQVTCRGVGAYVTAMMSTPGACGGYHAKAFTRAEPYAHGTAWTLDAEGQCKETPIAMRDLYAVSQEVDATATFVEFRKE